MSLPHTHRPVSIFHDEATWRRFRERLSADSANRALFLRETEPWLTQTAPSVVAKKHCAPTGNPHDYLSIAPYCWPDPAKPDGLPWIVRDGEVNPVFYEYDNFTLETFSSAANHLLLSSALTDDAHYAKRAGQFLRAWFVDGDTCMNPNLRYGQFIPGKWDGCRVGIIDTNSLVFVLDAALRLPFNDEWTPAHLRELKVWAGAYLRWLQESDFGREEATSRNNHGTWYDAQVVALAVFCDRPEIARQQIETITIPRLGSQLAPDGSQPHELGRTLSFTYSTYNLLGFACIARVASRFDIDVWSHTPTGNGGASLLTALRWMEPYWTGKKPWPRRQLKPFECSNAALLLSLAWQGTGDARFLTLLERIPHAPWQEITFSKPGFTGRKAPPSAQEKSVSHSS